MKIKFDTVFNSFNNKIVKCTLNCTVYDLKPHFNLIGINNKTLINDTKVESRLCFPEGSYAYTFTVTGTAKCHKEDKFNEIIGKRISESKATIKACKIASEICYRIYTDLMTKATNFSNDTYRIEKILRGEMTHLAMLKRNTND